MTAYDQMIRDLARRDIAKTSISMSEIAVIVDQYPDVVAEALEPALMADALRNFSSHGVGHAVISMLRVRCIGYVFREVEQMRVHLRQEELEDKEFQREVV